MDTKSKKSNRLIITKIIAVLLCVVCFAGCVNQGLVSLYEVTEAGIYDRAFEDAFIYGGKSLDEVSITDTKTFRHHFERYSHLLSVMIGGYGEGTAEDYDSYKKKVEQSNEAQKRFTSRIL